MLYLAGLSRSGYANEFYAAAVQAGTKSWKAFLFGSLDSSNFITVDKTPASLWVMELSGRAFGFSSWSLLAPQALEGVAAVGVLYATVRRWSGPAAATIAGAVLALTPVAALSSAPPVARRGEIAQDRAVAVADDGTGRHFHHQVDAALAVAALT